MQLFRPQDLPENLKSVRLEDIAVIATLGVGGFGRVELVCNL